MKVVCWSAALRGYVSRSDGRVMHPLTTETMLITSVSGQLVETERTRKYMVITIPCRCDGSRLSRCHFGAEEISKLSPCLCMKVSNIRLAF